MRMGMLVVVLLGALCSVTSGQLHGNGSDTNRSCVIPAGPEYLVATFSLAYHADHLAFENQVGVLDGNWNFLPGAHVLHGMDIRVTCSADQYGDAVHRSHDRRCEDGSWSEKLPNCTVHHFCGPPHVTMAGAVLTETVTSHQTFAHNHALQYACAEHYEMQGDNSIVCRDGNWTVAEFQCVNMQTCQAPDLPGAVITSGTLDGGVYPDHYVLTYTCGPGYHTAGSGILVCQGQRWTHATGDADACDPYIVSGLDVSGVIAVQDKQRVVVTWELDGNQSDVQYFRVLYTKEFGEPAERWDYVWSRGNASRAVLGGLAPARVYKVAVVAGDGAGEGPLSSPYYLYVDKYDSHGEYGDYYEANMDYSDSFYDVTEAPPTTETIPNSPENVSASFHGDHVLVSWDKPEVTSALILAYVVEYRTEVGAWQQTEMLFAPRSSWKLYDLQPEESYWIRVVAQGFGVIQSMPSEEVNLTLPRGPRGCGPLPFTDAVLPDDGNESDVVPHGAVVNVTCGAGMVLEGNGTALCNNGTWLAANFTCIEHYSCNASALPSQAVPDVTFSACTHDACSHGFTVTFTCAPGEELRGNPDVTCNDGMWSPVEFQCINNTPCSWINIPKGRLDPRQRKYEQGSKVSYICRRRGRWGRLARHRKLKCREGRWLGNRHACVRRNFRH